MWKKIQAHFKRQKSRLEVVRKMIGVGMRTDEEGKLYIRDVEVADTAVARAVGVDRRVVRSTVKQILRDKELLQIFVRVQPVGASMVDIAEFLGYSVLVVTADPYKPGVIAGVTGVLAKYGLVVKQALADDPDFVLEPRLTLIVSGKIPPEVIDEVRVLPFVKSLAMVK